MEISEIRKKIKELKAVKAKQKAKRKAKMMASSKIHEAKIKEEKERASKAAKAAKSLTKNLPESNEHLNPNWQHPQLRSQLAEHAFESALEDGVTFINTKGDQLGVKTGTEVLKVLAGDLKEQAKALIDWSGLSVGHLTDKDGKIFDHFGLHSMLIFEAAKYKRERQKEKSSKELLALLTETFLKKGFRFDPRSNREAVKAEMANKIAEVANDLELGFKRDGAGTLYLHSRDRAQGMTRLEAKRVEEYFQYMIDAGNAAGKLKATGDAQDLISGFAAKMPRADK